MRWDEAGKKRNTWGDILAVVHTEPADGPIHRAQEPNDWRWYTLHYDQLQNIAEIMATLATLTGNQSRAKKSQFPERAKRPWDKSSEQETKEFKFEPTLLSELDSWLDSRMS